MKVMIFDKKRNWIGEKLKRKRNGYEVSNFEPQAVLTHDVEIVLVHDSDFKEEYVLADGQTWQQLYSDIFKGKKIVVYSGGEIKELQSSADLIIIPWKIPYDENSCPDTFREYLKSLDENLLIGKQSAHLSVLHLFLPLDIDMQALGLLLKEKREAEAVNYFREMLTGSKAYHERILNDAEELLKQMSEDKREKVQAKFNTIKPFLDTLCNLQQKEISEKEFFNDKKNEGLKEDIKNFHDWYCALAECLRGEKVCKE